LTSPNFSAIVVAMNLNDPGLSAVTGNMSATTCSPRLTIPSMTFEAPATQKDKVESWFIDPLRRMRDHEGFVCLMVCFPLVETIIRYEQNIDDEDPVSFSDNSPALHWFAEFMRIPEAQARTVWNAFRNGLSHRAMVAESIEYGMTGKGEGRPAEFKEGKIFIYVWDLRDAVVAKLEKHHSKLWRNSSNPLAKIYVSS
jgi:hypothetical protein